jgi:hypothetical protein
VHVRIPLIDLIDLPPLTRHEPSNQNESGDRKQIGHHQARVRCASEVLRTGGKVPVLARGSRIALARLAALDDLNFIVSSRKTSCLRCGGYQDWKGAVGHELSEAASGGDLLRDDDRGGMRLGGDVEQVTSGAGRVRDYRLGVLAADA